MNISARAQPQPAPKSVLLVDDEPLNRICVGLMLEPLGYTVSFAENGQQGVDACTRQVFDIILMDVRMPIMDGYAAVREIRARETAQGRARTPTAIFSSSIGQQGDALAAHCGADGVIAKPASLEALLEGMSAACEHALRLGAARSSRQVSNDLAA